MKPYSLSATALNTAEQCLRRFKGEHIDRTKSVTSDAALFGTTCHLVLEMFVQECYIKKTETPTLQLLFAYLDISWMTNYPGVERKGNEEYAEAKKILKEWFERTNFSGVEVISTEVKESFPVPYPDKSDSVPFNYILDRRDLLEDGTPRVVDYKTNRWGLNPEQLRKKRQAQVYGLAMQIKYPEADRILVEFDMLRHGGPVGVFFTRDDNKRTWAWIKGQLERILDAPDDPTPRLNNECLFCGVKASCPLLTANVAGGGVFSLDSNGINRRAALDLQAKAIRAAIEEIDAVILAAAREQDVVAFETDDSVVEVKINSRRTADPERVRMVIGDEMFLERGSSSITLKTVDELLKGSELTAEQKRALEGTIYRRSSEPSVSSRLKTPDEKDLVI